MKFTLAAASTFITAALAATLPKSFTLVADGGNTVLTDNSMYPLPPPFTRNRD